MTTIIPDQPLPRRTESGMHTRAVNAAAGVLLAAMENGRQTPTGLAIALDSACLLNSPEHAAEDVRLRAERNEFCDRVDTLTAVAKGNKRHAAELFAELQAAQARVAELETERHTTNEALDDAVQALREAQARLAEYERPADEDPIAYTLTEKAGGTYPPALPWAKLMDADDLEGFLADLADAASGDEDLSTLAEVESAIARWRAIGEAQHAHNTAPGPDAEAGAR